MNYHFIYWIIIVALAFAVWAYREKVGIQKDKKKVWKASYNDAKKEWANQSDALRKKGIDLAIAEKGCVAWQKDYIRLEKELKELKKRLKDSRITI